MSAPPIAADHSEEYAQLAGLSALRALDGEDEERFEQHARLCERCRLIVRLDRETAANLSLAAPAMDPSPGFKERLMQRAAAELGQAARPTAVSPPAARPTAVPPTAVPPPVVPPPAVPAPVAEPIPLRPRPSNVVPFRRRQVWLSALAAVLVLGIALGSAASYQNQVVATYALSGSAPGEAVVLVRRSGAVELEMHGVGDPPPGFVYEAWIIPPGRQPVAAGVVSSGEAKVPLPPDARGTTVAITLERGPNGTQAPTSAPLMAGAVAS
jgi:anti-sigma-K factor RskA